MSELNQVMSKLPEIPADHLIALAPLGAFALAAWAIYVVHAVVKERNK